MKMEKSNSSNRRKSFQTRQSLKSPFLKFQRKKKYFAVFLGLILSSAPAITNVAETFAETQISQEQEILQEQEISHTQETPQEQEIPYTQEILHTQETPQEQPNFSLYAKSAVLMDAENGRVLYEKNG